MSDYTRIVSYFYRYQNGSKMENVGFSRAECRQEQLRVTLHLNDGRMHTGAGFDVYLYRYEKGTMDTVRLGKAEFVEGNLHYHEERPLREWLRTDVKLSQFSGIIAYRDESLFYGSQWDDEPIYSRDFVRAMRQREGAAKEEWGNEEMAKEKTVSRFARDGSDASEATYDAGAGEEPPAEAEEKMVAAQEECEPQSGEAKEGIEYLLKHRNPLPDFANHEVMQCVRIMPEDIGLMKRENWDYGNNSFVMHGFYNYRYLLLGSMQYADGTRQYVIGVPGIFSNKDKYLAGIFGFHEFIPLHSCPFKTGEFGYWIGKLK